MKDGEPIEQLKEEAVEKVSDFDIELVRLWLGIDLPRRLTDKELASQFGLSTSTVARRIKASIVRIVSDQHDLTAIEQASLTVRRDAELARQWLGINLDRRLTYRELAAEHGISKSSVAFHVKYIITGMVTDHIRGNQMLSSGLQPARQGDGEISQP